MITIFRKIRQNLLAEGKSARYLKYAVGEIFLVVIGILIALQINTWNENRKEDNFEQKILRELKSDYLYNESELKRNINKASALALTCDSLLSLLEVPDQEVDLIKFTNYTRRLGGYSTFNPSNGALVNLISSGNLNIIKNDSLRMHLSRWSGILDDVKEDEKRLIEFGDARMDPFRLQNIDQKTETARINPVLLDNLEFENTVRRIRSSAKYNVQNYEILGVEIQRILDDINGELIAD